MASLQERENRMFVAMDLLRRAAPHLFKTLPIVSIEYSKEPKLTAKVGFNKKIKRYEIFLGENFCGSICEKGLSKILHHELYHIVLGHFNFKKKYNAKVMGYATDAIVNSMIDFEGTLHTLAPITMETIYRITGVRFSADKHTSLDIYEELLKHKDKIPDKPTNIDEHGDPSHSGEEEEESSIEKEMFSEMVKEVMKNNQDIFQKAGKKSAEMARAIKEMVKPKNNFLHMFEMAMTRTLRQDRHSTWRVSSRRYEGEKGIKKIQKPKGLVVVDTSGSITDDILKKMNGMIAICLKKMDLTVCWGDEKLKGYKSFKRGSTLDCTYKGGGGTDLNFYKKVPGKYDIVVFATDGYIAPIHRGNCPLVFCIFDRGQKVKGYLNILMEN